MAVTLAAILGIPLASVITGNAILIGAMGGPLGTLIGTTARTPTMHRRQILGLGPKPGDAQARHD